MIPATNATWSPEMANKCIVPDCMNGAATSLVNPVRHPNAIAHSNSTAGSFSGNPRPKVARPHA